MRRPEDVTLTIGGGTVTENQPIFYYAPAKGWDKGTFRGFTKTKPAAPLPHHSGTHSGTKDPPNNSDGRPIVVRNAQGETFELAVRDVYLPLAETFTNAPPADLLALQELHHSVLVHALRERHAKDLCYTFLGSLLVYLNPFSYTIPHYSLSKIDDYLDRAPNPHVHDDSIGHELPPHVWSVAHRVFFEMRNSRKNSSIIISGESGSGKTEACKVALHYLCCLSADLVGADRPPHPQQQQLGGGDGGATHSHKTNPTANNETAAGNIKRLIEKVNASNPIMEAFGNAKTARNDNSSRFGKLLEVQFSSSGEIGAMRISPFLLEKSRCVTSAQDERVYHSFYQLVAGASDAAKTELKIKTVRDFPMLSRGGSVQVQGVNDAKEFEMTQNAFIQMGFSKDERDFVWRIVAAVLHLSTITFVGQTAPPPSTPSSAQNNMAGPGSPRGGAGGIASSARAMFEQASQQNNNNNNNKPGSNNNNNNENKSAPIKSSLSTLKTDKEDPQANLPAQLSTASVSVAEFIAEKLLKVDVAEFKRLLTASVSVLKNEEVVKILTRAKAAEQRDSLCKYLYSSLFYWIIEKINVATNDHNSDFVSANSISILDIFGFEDFAAGNSLEQLCINLANEALQRHYCKHVFERDAEEIAMEGVSAETVKFVDNEPCVQLIMGPDSSLFTLLEDASLLDLDRGNTDQNLKYLEKITQKHKPDFGTSAKQAKSKSVTDRDMTELIKPSDFFGRSQRDPDGFVVKHFASDVRYAVDGFVEKNSDTLKEAMRNLLGCSDDGMMQELLNLGEAAGGGGNNNNNEPGSPISSKATPTSPRTAGGGGAAGSRVRRPVGIVGQFKRSLQELLSTLDNTSPNWIRCIRPHPKKAPKLFDSKSVLEQLMATGVLETITQRQRNFPFRLEIQNFVHRFGVVCAGNSSFKRMARSSLHEKCTAILTAASLGTRGGAQVGKTKVFLRTENLNKLERVRQDRVTIQAAVAQRFAAAFAARKMRRELEVEAASKRIKRWYKRFRLVKKVVKDYYEELIRKKKERDEAARQDLIILEGKERALAQNMEKSDRAPYANKHREQLTPLLKAATAHLVKVEPSFREKISKLEYSERSVLVKNEQIEKKLALERQIAREEAEERAFDDAINSLAGEVNSLRKEVRDEEKVERAELEKFWRPIHADILRLANRVRNLNEQREDRIRKLKDEMEKEKQRIKEAEERRIASEARLWSSLGGPKHMQKDIEKLVSLGLSDIEVERTMKKFFASGIPSQMLLSSNNNNNHHLDHGIPEASARNQQSLKDVYLERIRNSSSSSTTSSSSSQLRPGSSRESSTSENYRLHAPVGNVVTLDGYSSKLKAEYENAVKSGKVSVMPSEAKYEAARQVIAHNSASTTQFSSRNDDFSRSALDSANISTKARDYAKYAKALKEKQQKEQHQQHVNQNQQQQVQFLDPHMLMMMNSNPSSVTNNNSRKYVDDDDDDDDDNRNNVPGFVWKKV